MSLSLPVAGGLEAYVQRAGSTDKAGVGAAPGASRGSVNSGQPGRTTCGSTAPTDSTVPAGTKGLDSGAPWWPSCATAHAPHQVGSERLVEKEVTGTLSPGAPTAVCTHRPHPTKSPRLSTTTRLSPCRPEQPAGPGSLPWRGPGTIIPPQLGPPQDRTGDQERGPPVLSPKHQSQCPRIQGPPALQTLPSGWTLTRAQPTQPRTTVLMW